MWPIVQNLQKYSCKNYEQIDTMLLFIACLKVHPSLTCFVLLTYVGRYTTQPTSFPFSLSEFRLDLEKEGSLFISILLESRLALSSNATKKKIRICTVRLITKLCMRTTVGTILYGVRNSIHWGPFSKALHLSNSSSISKWRKPETFRLFIASLLAHVSLTLSYIHTLQVGICVCVRL